MISLSCGIAFCSDAIFAQPANGFYEGWEKHSSKKLRNTAMRNILEIRGDSLFLSSTVMQKTRRGWQTMDAVSVVYYYFGRIRGNNTDCSVLLMLNNCDYCGTRMYTDSLTGYHYPIWDTTLHRIEALSGSYNKGFIMAGIRYSNMKAPPYIYCSDARFFYDENNIRREDPPGQYALISEGIKELLNSDTLQYYCPIGDTLFICTQRWRKRYGKADSLLEQLEAKGFALEGLNRYCVFATRDSIYAIAERLKRPLRYIEIGAIHDRKISSIITLNYSLFLPTTVRHFKGGEHHSELWFEKVGERYILDRAFFEGWSRVER